LIVFSSDNGGERWAKNWPFVGEKGDLTEGGIRVPFLIRWRSAIDGGQVSDRPNITMDWTATMLDAAGTAPHPDYPLDGASLVPYLVDGAAYPDHDLCWRTTSQLAVRRGDMKYLHDRRLRPRKLGLWPLEEGDFHLLYDVTADGRERADLAPHHTELVAELCAAAERFEQEMLPYPPDPGPPHQASAHGPPVGHPD
jgi:arylsulfatase A-like enzyme